MINLTGVRVTGLTFQETELGKFPTVLILGLTQENMVYSCSYDANEIKESLKACMGKKDSDVKQGFILASMLIMLGEVTTEDDLECLYKEALQNGYFNT